MGVVTMTQLEINAKEIACRRKCYAVCAAYDAEDFDTVIACACEDAAACGAETLHLTMRDETCPLTADAYMLGGRSFVWEADFALLEKELTAVRQEAPSFRTKRMRAGNAALFCALYNEAFYSVPNAATMDEAEAKAIEADEKRDAGFFMGGGEPMGVYVLDYRESTPEIAAVCIRPEWQGRGYGTRALHTLEMQLAMGGYTRVQLLVAEQNVAAYALYMTAGYRYSRRHSRWYRTQL